MVRSGAGKDTLWVWHQKTIDFDGGKRSDTIRFEYQTGSFPQAASGAVVDLAAGTGTNPHGGEIKLNNIENVIGQFGKSNDLLGNESDNFLRGGVMSDTLRQKWRRLHCWRLRGG